MIASEQSQRDTLNQETQDHYKKIQSKEVEKMIVHVKNFNSSNVESFEYDTTTEDLNVTYKNRKTYTYKRITKSVFDNLFSQASGVGSVGGAMQFIKQNFDCEGEK